MATMRTAPRPAEIKLPPPRPPVSDKPDASSPSLGYKIMTVFMVIVCAMNIIAFVVALIMFALVYRVIKTGKAYEKIDAQMDAVQGTAATNLSSLLTTAIHGGASEFIVGTANSVIYRFGGQNDQFKNEDIVACHQTARVAAQSQTTST